MKIRFFFHSICTSQLHLKAFREKSTIILSIHHFTVACLVAWPLNESEAGDDIVLIETFLLFYVNDIVLMLISTNLHKKSS